MRVLCTSILLMALACGGDDTAPDADLGDSSVDASVDGDAAVDDGDTTPDAIVDFGPDAGPLVVSGDGNFDLNDVSFLFPMPVEGEAAPTAGDDGAGGAFLSEAIETGLPEAKTGAVDMTFRGFALTGVRVDDCFQVDATRRCQHQIRLVFQAVARHRRTRFVMEEFIEEEVFGALDITLHLLYNLDNESFRDLVVDLSALRELAAGRTDGAKLTTHPVLAEEGLTGSYGQALMNLVRKFASESNLSEVAIMNLGFPAVIWEFEAFRIATPLEPLKIVGIDQETTQQRFFRDLNTQEAVVNQFLPPIENNGLVAILEEPVSATSTDADIQSAITRSHEIENPRLVAGGGVDCVSCHIAGRARRAALASLGRPFGTDQQYNNATYNLEVVDIEPASELLFQRNFGYGGTTFDQPVASARTVHESAEVADALRALVTP